MPARRRTRPGVRALREAAQKARESDTIGAAAERLRDTAQIVRESEQFARASDAVTTVRAQLDSASLDDTAPADDPVSAGDTERADDAVPTGDTASAERTVPSSQIISNTTSGMCQLILAALVRDRR